MDGGMDWTRQGSEIRCEQNVGVVVKWIVQSVNREAERMKIEGRSEENKRGLVTIPISISLHTYLLAARLPARM